MELGNRKIENGNGDAYLPSKSGVCDFVDETDACHGHKRECKTDYDATGNEHVGASCKRTNDGSRYLKE